MSDRSGMEELTDFQVWETMNRPHNVFEGVVQLRYKFSCGHQASLLVALTAASAERYMYGCEWELYWMEPTGGIDFKKEPERGDSVVTVRKMLMPHVGAMADLGRCG